MTFLTPQSENLDNADADDEEDDGFLTSSLPLSKKGASDSTQEAS